MLGDRSIVEAGGGWYRAGVLLAGLPALAVVRWAAAAVDLSDWRGWWVAATVVLAMHTVSRRFPLRIATVHGSSDATAGTAFGFALLLVAPVPVAVLALTASSLIPLRRPSELVWHQVVIEMLRTLFVFGSAGAVLDLLGMGSTSAATAPTWQLLVMMLPAGLVGYVVDVSVTVGATALAQGTTVRSVLRQDRRRFDVRMYLLLVGFAPAIVVLAERSLLLMPLLVAGLVGLYGSARVAASQQHDASHDQLTGLANLRLLERRLTELVAGSSLDDQFALLLMDLDRFKEVNDRLGHHVGDELLAEVGHRFKDIDGIDLAARIGGDEFAFVLRRAVDHPELVAIAERLVTRASQPYVVADIRLAIGASVGIAVFPDHGLDGPSLLRRADSAMYAAKRGGVPVGFAQVNDAGSGPGRVSMLGELEEAMRREDLSLVYQPKMSLHTGEITGIESLLRWHHPEHGLVPPEAFVRTVEHTELIAPLTRYIVRRVIADLERWSVAGISIPIAINISARDLQDTRFPRDLADLLAGHGIAADILTLEITETALQVDPDRATQVMTELRELGVHLSIDDFGTGYSSLAALRHLPVGEMKIDRTFVRGMADDAGKAIVRSIIQLGHALGHVVVAEGVEDEETLEELRVDGCDVAQGFWLSRPLPAHLVAPWVRARRQELADRSGADALDLESRRPRGAVRAI